MPFTTDALTADAVLQMAIQMEELGRDLYISIGSVSSDAAVVSLCRKLANDESAHHTNFRAMRSKLAQMKKTVLLSDEVFAQARQQLREAIVPDARAVRQMILKGKTAELLALAMKMETDSVRFYSAMSVKLGSDETLLAIIHEEQEHLRQLSASLSTLQTRAS